MQFLKFYGYHYPEDMKRKIDLLFASDSKSLKIFHNNQIKFSVSRYIDKRKFVNMMKMVADSELGSKEIVRQFTFNDFPNNVEYAISIGWNFEEGFFFDIESDIEDNPFWFYVDRLEFIRTMNELYKIL